MWSVFSFLSSPPTALESIIGFEAVFSTLRDLVNEGINFDWLAPRLHLLEGKGSF